MTRPFDRHLDDEELNALLSLPVAPQSGSESQGQGVTDSLSHAQSCEECRHKVFLHKRMQSELSQLALTVSAKPSGECPRDVDWLRVAAGMLPDASREVIIHAAQCDYCGPLLRKAVAALAEPATPDEEQMISSLASAQKDWQERLARSMIRQTNITLRPERVRAGGWSVFHLSPRWAILVGTLFLLAAAGWFGFNFFRTRTANQLLAKAYTERRTLEMRIEGARYVPLAQERGLDRSQSRINQPLSLLEAETTIATQLKSHPDDPIWLQALGRADLLEGNYEAALNTLQKAESFSPDNASIAVDLATAYFMRGERFGLPADYGTAVNILGKVTTSHPNDPLARFNYAVSLERIPLYQQAVVQWHKFLELDPNSEWSVEARARLSTLEEKLHLKKSGSEIPLRSPESFLAMFDNKRRESASVINEHIELYQDLVVEQWLPVVFSDKAGGHPGSRAARRAVDAVADLLKSQHQDHWLGDLLRQEDSAPNPGIGIDSLARAVRLNHTADRDGARRSALEAAKSFRKANIPAGELRALFEVAYADQLVHQNQACFRAAQELSKLLEHKSYIWLRIQTLLESAVCASLSDEKSIDLATRAQELAEGHHYSILQMRATTLLASLSWSVGNPTAAWKFSADGLGRYWANDYPQIRGYNLYTNLDYLAEDAQQWFLQSVVLAEATQMIQDTPDPVLRAVAQTRLSQALFMTGDLSATEANIHDTERLFADAPDGSRKRNLQAEAEIGLANVELRRGEAEKAVAKLLRIQPMIGRIPDKDLSLEFFKSLGMAQMKAGDNNSAEHSLASALYLAEDGLRLVSSERKRLEWSRKNEVAYRAMVQLRFADHPENAFEYWEWYKGASLRTGGVEHTSRPAIASLPPRILPISLPFKDGDQTAGISYAMFDDRIIVWIYDVTGIRSRSLDLPRPEIEHLARRFVEHCSDRSFRQENLWHEASQLYREIFLPIEPLIRNHKHLLIEPDGALDLVPFEALIDQNGTYVGDLYSVTLSTGIDYLTAAGEWLGLSKKNQALVVGDPTNPDWAPLPGTEEEARDIAGLFEHSRLLLRGAATYAAIGRELPRADVFHFAGHGISSPNAAGPVLSDSGLLDVSKLDHLRLGRLKLVVLSACDSAKGTTEMFNDHDSTVRLLIGAGVPEVVASRWAVDSKVTTKFMTTFYDQLFKGKNVADSLRLAAIGIRQNAATAHPFYWASFAAFGKS